MYSENASAGKVNNAGVVDLPVGCSIFPREIFPAPRDWAEKVFPKLIYWNEVKRGGHFAAFEEGFPSGLGLLGGFFVVPALHKYPVLH